MSDALPAGTPPAVAAALASEKTMAVPGGGSGFASRHESDAEAALFDFESKAAAKAEETTKAPAKGKETVAPPEDEQGSEAPPTEVEGAEETEAEPKEKEAEEPEGITLADDLDGLAEQVGMKPDELAAYLKVKVGDKSIPLADVLKGYSPEAKAREAELAESRVKFDEAVGQARTTWQQKMQQVDGLLGYLKGQFSQRQLPDAKLLDPQHPEYDPARYLREKEAFGQDQEAFQQIMGARLQIQQHEQAEAQVQKEKMLGEQYNLLVKALPDLADEGKWKAWAGDIRAYAKSVGLSDDLLADVHHHQAWVMMDKARKWDALQKGKAEINKRIGKLPPLSLKPGVKSRPMDESTRTLLDARKRLARNGNDPDAGAALFENIFRKKSR